jgi:hypothetical protein
MVLRTSAESSMTRTLIILLAMTANEKPVGKENRIGADPG